MALVDAGTFDVFEAPSRASSAAAAPPRIRSQRLSLRRLTKMLGGRAVVSDLDLDVSPGEVLALVGPSGCGKSTTLRLIAGVDDAGDGEIWIGNRPVDGLPPGQRDTAMVFQSCALYPHLTVYRNLALPLELRKVPRQEVERRVEEIAGRFDITYLLNRKPRLLSGGQRQLVALARALMRSPSILLLDEPFSNLDAQSRAKVRAEFVRMRAAWGTTCIYVGHDQAEAMAMADRIAMMRDGRIVQVGTPQELLEQPADTFVAGFVGTPPMNLLPARLEGTGPAFAGGSLAGSGREVLVGIRPEWFEETPANYQSVPFAGEVRSVELTGAAVYVTVASDAGTFIANLPSQFRARSGDRLTLWADMTRARLFDRSSGKAIP